MNQTKFYQHESGTIAYRQINDQLVKYQNVELIFLGGFHSNMNGTKARFLEEYCQLNNHSITFFDYFGHGESSGRLIDGTIDKYLKDSLLIIDQLTTKKLIIIGSSMGGWLMLLAALARTDRVAGLIGLAPAIDFTEELIWNKLSSDQQASLKSTGSIQIEGKDNCNYLISYELINEARNHLLLNKKLLFNYPILIHHALDDQTVPFKYSVELVRNINNNEQTLLKLINNSSHYLTSKNDLSLLQASLEEMLLKLT